MGRTGLAAMLAAATLAAASGAAAQSPSGPVDRAGPTRVFTDVRQINERSEFYAQLAQQKGAIIDSVRKSCPLLPFEARADLDRAIQRELEMLRGAKAEGPDAAAIQLRIDSAIVQLELIKADVPTFEQCADHVSERLAELGRNPPPAAPPEPAKPAAPPAESILDEIDYVDPVIGAKAPPKTSEIEEDVDELLDDQARPDRLPDRTPPPPAEPPLALPDGVTRPPLQPTISLVVPDRFCSELDRNAFLEGVYNPAAAGANAYAQAATAYQAQVVEAANSRMRAGEGLAWGALLDERKTFEPVMQQALAYSRETVALYPLILAVPVGDCPALSSPQPPAGPAQVIPQAKPVQVAQGPAPAKDCPPKAAREPIIVGRNAQVGSGARLRAKMASTALGLAGNLLGGGLPGGGGGGGAKGPPMVNCRIKDSEMTVFQDPATGTALKVGARQAGDTLVVFAKIDHASDSGTFQTAFLQRPDGAVLAPSNVGICDLWGEWKLTVSWTRETYVDNQLVKRETGGWSEGGRFSIPGVVSSAERPDGLWRRLGFSNASHGARMVALQFKVPAGEMAAAPMDLVVHVTRPSADPVITVPFALRATQTGKAIGFDEAPPLAGCPPLAGGLQIAGGGPALEPTRVSNNTTGAGPSTPRSPGGGPTEDGPAPTPIPASTPEEPAVESICGPDVTDAYLRELRLAWARLSRLSDDEKGFYDGTHFLRRNGMNVDATPAGVEGKCPLGPCAGENDKKQPCYRLFGVCTPRHVFNDLLFGLLGRGLGVPVWVQKAGGHAADVVNYSHLDSPISQQAYAVGSAFGDVLEETGGLTEEQVQALPIWTEFVAMVRAEYPFTLQCRACPEPAPGRIIKSFARSSWQLEDGSFDRFETATAAGADEGGGGGP